MRNSVKQKLTARRERQVTEYAAMVRRVIRAHGRRVADADPEDLVELVELRTVVELAIADAIDGMRREPRQASWTEIGRALGITRQAAQQRYGDAP